MPAKLGEPKSRGKRTYSERFDDGVLVRAGLTAELVADFGDELQGGLVHRDAKVTGERNPNSEEGWGFGGFARAFAGRES